MKTLVLLTWLFIPVGLLLTLPAPCRGQGASPARQGPGAGREDNFQSLISKARLGGSVRVIVRLDLDLGPAGAPVSPGALRMRTEAVARAQDALLSRLSRYGPASVTRFESIPFIAFELNAGALIALRALPEVLDIGEDRLAAPTLAESVPLIGAPRVWAAGYSGAGQVIAVLDTGVDKTHSFLSGKVVSEACYSTNSPANRATSVCPGGVNQTTAVGSGVPCTGISGCDHGTHVAGIAAGRGPTFSGVARDANLIAVQVFSRVADAAICHPRPAPCVKTFASDQVKGLERVLALAGSYNIAAVNMSLGGGRYYNHCDATDTANAALKAAVDNLRAAGTVTVAASGNDSYADSINSPACISSAVSVGSTTDGSQGAALDTVSNFSNSANILSLLAPGQWINASVPGGGFGLMSGTSMAAPHVAGAWAVYRSRFPGAPVGGALAALQSAGMNVHDARNGIVKPRLQLDAALLPTYTLTNAPSSQTVTAGNSASIAVNVAQQGGFGGNVGLSVTGLPAGAVPRFAPASVSAPGTSTLTVTTSDDTPPGTYTYVAVGVSGGMRRTALGSLTVLPSPKDFSVAVTPASQNAVVNGSVDYAVTLTPIAGYSRAVRFRAAGLPSPAYVSFMPDNLPGTGSARMSINTPERMPAGTYSVTVTGTDGFRQRSATATLVVPRHMSLSADRNDRRILSGESTQYGLTLAQNFSGPTSFNVSGLPAGAAPTFYPTSLGGSGATTLTVATSGPGVEGTFPLNVRAAGSGLTSGVPVTLTVRDHLRFGVDGMVNTAFGRTNTLAAAALQPDGKILTAGSVDSCPGCQSFDFLLVRYKADGSLDETFGAGGKVATDFGGGDDQAHALAVQPDGKIVVAGQTRGHATFNDFALARYNADGSPDTSFGSRGKVVTDIAGEGDYGRAVALQSDGKIVLAGHVLSRGYERAAVARYNKDGSLDWKVTHNFSPNFSSYLAGVALQADQKIVVTGYGYNSATGSNDFLLARLRPDGALDTSFAGRGYTFTDISGARSDDYARALTIQPDGKIVTAGLSQLQGAWGASLSRHDRSGAIDTSFGDGGRVALVFGGNFASAEAVALQPGGKIVVGGMYGRLGSSYDFLVARLDTDGSPDPSFGEAGRVTADFLAKDEKAVAVAVQPDGKIVAAGNVATLPSSVSGLLRVNADGGVR